jgi:hypothetical protein
VSRFVKTTAVSHVTQNIGLVRRMCLNLTRSHPEKDSMAVKLKAAGWNDEFRAQLIFGNAA